MLQHKNLLRELWNLVTGNRKQIASDTDYFEIGQHLVVKEYNGYSRLIELNHVELQNHSGKLQLMNNLLNQFAKNCSKKSKTDITIGNIKHN